MDWEVSGAHRDTGKEAVVIVQGETAEEAASAAAALGLFVSRTKPRASPSHPAGAAQAAVEGTVTTQRTGKGWKALMLLGALLMIVGVPTMVLGITTAVDAGGESDAGAGPFVFGLLATLVGVPILILARVGAWWFHG